MVRNDDPLVLWHDYDARVPGGKCDKCGRHLEGFHTAAIVPSSLERELGGDAPFYFCDRYCAVRWWGNRGPIRDRTTRAWWEQMVGD